MTAHSTIRPRAIRGVVLAGGENRRMGEPKALLRLPDGTTWLAHAAGILAAATGRTPLISVPHASRAGSRLLAAASRLAPRGVVADASPECGPVAGVLAALEHLEPGDDALLWIAVDMPRLGARDLLDFLGRVPADAGAAVAVYRGRVQPACGLLGRDALSLARRAAAQRRGLIWLLEAASATRISLPRRAGGSPLLSIDTPATWRSQVLSVSRPAPAARS